MTSELDAGSDLAIGYPTPEGDLRLRPRAAELAAVGRDLLRGLAPRARRQQELTWTAAGLAPPQHPLRLAASGLADEVFLNIVRAIVSKPAGLGMHRIVEETHAAAKLYDGNGWLDEPAKFHRDPPPLDPITSTRKLRDLHFLQLRGSDPWEPPAASPGSQRWLSFPGGQRPLAHVLMHPEPRPWLLLVHGAYMGDLRVDAGIFQAERLHRTLGLNLAMPTLPLHGERAPKSGISRSLPSLDTMDSIHGLAQAVYEVRALLGWIRQTQPDSRIGMYGVSLGAYVASLVAGLDSALDCVIVGVPAVDFPAVFDSQTPRSVRQQAFYEPFRAAVERVYTPVSPLSFTPATPLDRRYLYAARGDHVLPPKSQSIRLWQHWDKPTSYWFDGAHVPQVRNKKVRAFVVSALQAALLES